MKPGLKQRGIEVEENFIIDASCTNVMVRQQQGNFMMNTPVQFPYIPVITNFTEHPITDGLGISCIDICQSD